MMPRAGTVLGVALLGLALTHAPAQPGSYKTITVRGDALLSRALSGAEKDGYVVVAAGSASGMDGSPRSVLLLERSPVPVRHEVLESAERLDSPAVRERLDGLGERGCELRSRAVLVHEVLGPWLPEDRDDPRIQLLFSCEPGAAAVDYVPLVFRGVDDFQQRLAELGREGFEVAGLWNNGRHLQTILRRTPGTAGRDTGRPRLLLRSTFTGMRLALKSIVSEGWRIVAATRPSTAGAPVVLTDRVAPAGPAEYLLLANTDEKLRKDKLERKLRRYGKRGWRLDPLAGTDTTLGLFRIPVTSGEREAFEYRVLGSGEPPGLEAALEAAVEDGFELVEFVVTPGEAVAILIRPAAG